MNLLMLKEKANREAILREKDRVLTSLINFPEVNVKAVTKVARTLLLNSPYMINGSLREIRAKSLGIGVYSITLERKE